MDNQPLPLVFFSGTVLLVH
jgi:exonuclease 3'-5' domain-containing protein 1